MLTEIKVETFRVHAHCPKCNDINIVATGETFTLGRKRSYMHKCSACESFSEFDRAYPITEYREVVGTRKEITETK